jgi:Tol biopolymer transport system component
VKFVAALLGSVVVLSPVAGFGVSDARDFGAVFAPDGKTVSFVHADGGSASIDLVDANGSHERVLLPRVSPQHLAWSPDGTNLAYDTDTSIWRVDLATATPVRLTTDDPTHDVQSWQPAWSPDGNTIAYSRFQTCFRCTAIWLINSDGTSPRQIYDAFQARRPTFSPHGTRLALSLANDLVIDLEGNSIVAGGGAYTIWSPHGTYVAYTGSGLWIRNLHTRHPTASDATHRRANRLVAGRKVDRWRPAQVGRSRSRTGRIAPHEASRVGHQRRRTELLARPRRLHARRRMRHRHRPRGRQERAPAHTILLTRADGDAEARSCEHFTSMVVFDSTTHTTELT